MLFDELNISQGAEVWARTRPFAPDDCANEDQSKRSQILPPPQRNLIAKNYIKQEEEVMRCESKLNNWFTKFETISKETCDKLQKDDRLNKFVFEPVQKVVQNTLTPEVKENLCKMTKKAEQYVKTQTNRINQS